MTIIISSCTDPARDPPGPVGPGGMASTNEIENIDDDGEAKSKAYI